MQKEIATMGNQVFRFTIVVPALFFSLHPSVRFIYCFRILLWFVNITLSILFLFLAFCSIRFCAQQSNLCNFCGSTIVNWYGPIIHSDDGQKRSILRFPHKMRNWFRAPTIYILMLSLNLTIRILITSKHNFSVESIIDNDKVILISEWKFMLNMNMSEHLR